VDLQERLVQAVDHVDAVEVQVLLGAVIGGAVELVVRRGRMLTSPTEIGAVNFSMTAANVKASMNRYGPRKSVPARYWSKITPRPDATRPSVPRS
jgi:hypothetical protein